MPKSDTLAVPKSIVRRAIKVLEAAAHDKAAHSQYPYLFKTEETIAWSDAQKLKKMLKEQAGMIALPVKK